MQQELDFQITETKLSQLSFDNLLHATSANNSQKIIDEDFLQRFSKWLRIEVADGDASNHTIRSYISSTRCYLAWCEERDLNTTDATEDDLKLYRAFLVDQGYRRGTIGAKLSGIRRFYDALVHWGLCPNNPVDKVKARRDLTSGSDRVMEKYIPDREEFINLSTLPSPRSVAGKRDRAILRLMCYTGIRVSEMTNLNLIDLDLGQKPQITIRAGKGHKKRHSPLGREDVVFLHEWLAARNLYIDKESDAVFITLDNRTRGQRLGTRGIRSIVDKYLRLAGLKKPGRSCHALRHSFATWLLDAGVPIEAISDLLGHSSVTITAIYAKVVDHRKYTASDILK